MVISLISYVEALVMVISFSYVILGDDHLLFFHLLLALAMVFSFFSSIARPSDSCFFFLILLAQ